VGHLNELGECHMMGFLPRVHILMNLCSTGYGSVSQRRNGSTPHSM